MPDWPLVDGQLVTTHNVSLGSGTYGGGNISGAGANNKGPWFEILSSAPYDGLLTLGVRREFIANVLYDVGVGASGQEQVLIPNLYSSRTDHRWLHLPIGIPRGERLSARLQNDTGANNNFRIGPVLVGQGFMGSPPLQRCSAYGVSEAISAGTQVDAGATAGEKGSWVELTSGTARHHRMLMLLLGDTSSTVGFLVDVAIGASGSEQIVLENLFFRVSSAEMMPGVFGPVPLDIPQGTRVAVRAQCNTSATPGRLFRIAAYGMD